MKASLPAALFLLAAAAVTAGDAPAAAKSVLPFAEDDYAGAMKQARARKLPVFIEAWAPW